MWSTAAPNFGSFKQVSGKYRRQPRMIELGVGEEAGE